MALMQQQAANYYYYIMRSSLFPILILLTLIGLSNIVGCDCRELGSVQSRADHSSFLRANYNSNTGGRKWCANEPGTCSGSSMACCLNKYCTDVSSDSQHCGSCGHACGYGLSCCGGACVDLNTHAAHCGACFNACEHQGACSFGMCGYGS